MSVDRALALLSAPASLGRAAAARRAALYGDRIRIVPAPACAAVEGEVAALIEGDRTEPLSRWPDPERLRPGARVIVAIDRDEHVAELARWLERLGERSASGIAVAPWCPARSGLLAVRAIAVARLCLPAQVRVEARHDLLGLHCAQVAIGFGADTLAGPIEADRVLPLAGVSRPTEATLDGLQTLIRATGLEPELVREHAA